jgi:hypothetical protein
VRSVPRRRTSDARRDLLPRVDGLLEAGLELKRVAWVVGFHPSSFRRWRRRAARREALVKRRGPRQRCGEAAAHSTAAQLVRDLKGLVGVESLRHSVPGLSRREAAQIKHSTCTAMERERQAAAERVDVSVPGCMRGFDAMQLGPRERAEHLLVAGDASIPYRTSWNIVDRYTGDRVLDFLEHDLDTNGSPLVLRLDRAKQHQIAPIRELLAQRGVLILHGPPHRPTYYGQLERQNREHRAWLRAARTIASPLTADAMMHALNARWRRRTLGFKTAQELWNARPILAVDRAAFREEVTDRSERIRRSLDLRGKPADLPYRLGLEQVLEQRGFLDRSFAGRC